jgi:hypothetical protein
MGLAEKTRKILWARSGNQCAVCQTNLVLRATPHSGDTVLGEECHIVAKAGGGPRYDSTFIEDFDGHQNLILLCPTHHRVVDAQFGDYPATRLRQIKAIHEAKIEKLLTELTYGPLRVHRTQDPPPLVRLMLSGDQLFKCSEGVLGSLQDTPSGLTEEETELVGGFLQEFTDYRDIWDDIGPLEHMRAIASMGRQIESLLAAGFMVFAGREIRQIEGGGQPPSPWPIVVIQVARTHDALEAIQKQMEERR